MSGPSDRLTLEGDWTRCRAPQCRDAQRYVPAGPEVELGDAEEIANDLATCRPMGRFERVEPAPCGLSSAARAAALLLAACGLLVVALALSCGGVR